MVIDKDVKSVIPILLQLAKTKILRVWTPVNVHVVMFVIKAMDFNRLVILIPVMIAVILTGKILITPKNLILSSHVS